MGFFTVELEESSALVMQMLLFELVMACYNIASPAGGDFCFLYQNREETE
jgi:hypothetical protein